MATQQGEKPQKQIGSILLLQANSYLKTRDLLHLYTVLLQALFRPLPGRYLLTVFLNVQKRGL